MKRTPNEMVQQDRDARRMPIRAIVRTLLSVTGGIVAWLLVATLGHYWIFGGLSRYNYWTRAQVAAFPLSTFLSLAAAAFVAAGLAPRGPRWHAAPFALLAVPVALDWYAIGESWPRVFDVALAGPAGVAFGLSLACMVRTRWRRSSRLHLTSVGTW